MSLLKDFRAFRRLRNAPDGSPSAEGHDYGPFAPAETDSPYEGDDAYDDGTMKMGGRNVDFLEAPRFVEAHDAGLKAGLEFRWPGTDNVIDMPWRVHIACWAALHAVNLPGHLVECGVHTGGLSLAVCKYIDFNSTGKSFYLFDTFTGIPEEQMSEEERPFRTAENETYYREDSYEVARRNFQQYPRAHLIRGRVPDTLASVTIDAVSYLSLDMNIAAPEVAALEFFWPKLSVGAIVLLDDYGWTHYRPQKVVLDGFAAERRVEIATLPTGQGLLIKP